MMREFVDWAKAQVMERFTRATIYPPSDDQIFHDAATRIDNSELTVS